MARWWPPSYTRPTEGDTTTLEKTLAAAKENLEAVDAAPTAEDPAECVTDKGYHSRSVLKALDDRPLERTRFSEPNAESLLAALAFATGQARRAVTKNRTRLLSGVAKEAFKLRAEIVERSFAHNTRSRRHAPDMASAGARTCTSDTCSMSPATI